VGDELEGAFVLVTEERSGLMAPGAPDHVRFPSSGFARRMPAAISFIGDQLFTAKDLLPWYVRPVYS
jgi:hypothetical protein